MLLNVLLILLPLVIGYLIPLSSTRLVKLVNQSLGKMVYLILFLMGLGLAYVENLGSNLAVIFKVASIMLTAITLCNLLALWWLDRRSPPTHEASDGKMPSKLHLLWESLQLCFVVLGGVLLGLLVDLRALPIDRLSEWALMLLLLLIGIQMRNSGMHLRQILLNPWGMKIAATVIVSSWLGSLLAAQLLGMPFAHGLAMSSSFGWYSLSGILVADKLGPVLGSAAFINDLGRELIAILIIPILMRRHPSAAIGYGGATALDFTLPVIQKSGGIQVVPVAIVSGFLLSLLGPILILGFLAI
ncbi:lysine exporter LysO family protein [Aeromonas sp. FDAARGOS 1409]|uniref:lysine exporter LysO family protein n=1 Tax=Aeromonas TaxID=642 RepID=UPI001C22F35F|nr:lysine exporter LysO family protein [Aeromonas sp. FDAARGOS 1409]QXC29009.1 lysine exporter LysO family protein [Aeromonas sp. FDAARGOS 1409]